MYDGEAGAGESYFRKGRRGRSAAGKAAVFGLLKRNGKVCTVTVGHSNRYFIAYYPRTGETRQHCLYGLFVVTMYQIVSGFGRFRINRGTHFAERQNHINAIGNFWNRAKRHLRKFDGIPKEHFGLYLKECGRRFDNSGVKVRISILKQLVKQDLSRLAGILKNKYIL